MTIENSVSWVNCSFFSNNATFFMLSGIGGHKQPLAKCVRAHLWYRKESPSFLLFSEGDLASYTTRQSSSREATSWVGVGVVVCYDWREGIKSLIQSLTHPYILNVSGVFSWKCVWQTPLQEAVSKISSLPPICSAGGIERSLFQSDSQSVAVDSLFSSASCKKSGTDFNRQQL